MSAQRGGHRGGRIHPQQRETNDAVATIGADLAPPSDLAERYNETERQSMDDKCRRNYRQRIARIIRFWQDESPEYYQVGVHDVSATELADSSKYYFGQYDN